jgi:hypothetical protein
LRVAVYASVDPLTGRRHDLREVVAAGSKAAAEADRLKVKGGRCAAFPAHSLGTSPGRPAMCALARRCHAGMIVEVIEVRVR